MRSWEARGDTYVEDEPFYAHYLQETGVDHPGRDEIVASYEADWRSVVERLVGRVPEGKPIFYQKHMAHHLLPGMEGRWLRELAHGFLIRDPDEMLMSLSRVVDNPELEDTGLPQQWGLFTFVRDELGCNPPVVDARDVLLYPVAVLRALCDAFAVPFTQRMLSWQPGPRSTDGVWSKYWYRSVITSTGFRPYEPPIGELPARLRPVRDSCLPYYHRLYEHRITG